jgi:hypothetical protein
VKTDGFYVTRLFEMIVAFPSGLEWEELQALLIAQSWLFLHYKSLLEGKPDRAEEVFCFTYVEFVVGGSNGET